MKTFEIYNTPLKHTESKLNIVIWFHKRSHKIWKQTPKYTYLSTILYSLNILRKHNSIYGSISSKTIMKKDTMLSIIQFKMRVYQIRLLELWELNHMKCDIKNWSAFKSSNNALPIHHCILWKGPKDRLFSNFQYIYKIQVVVLNLSQGSTYFTFSWFCGFKF